MAAPWDVVVEVDVEEPRIDKGLLCASADGTLWDKTVGSDFWIDPVTKTLMLAPLPITAEWRTTFTGDYARLSSANYTLITSSKWIDNERGTAGNYYLESLGVNETVTTSTTYPENQPFYLSFYTGGEETIAEQTVLVCGWGEQGATGSVWLRVRANGQVSVYKGADIVGTYDIEGGLADAGQTKRTPEGKNQKTTSLLLLPCRRRSLVVVANGSGFEHVFADLDASVNTNTITPADSFFWNVPVGKASVQLAPVKFKESATVYSVAQTLRYPPATGATFEYLNAYDEFGPSTGVSTVTVSVAEEDGTALTPDGIIQTVRIKAVFAGDGTGSIGMYAEDAFVVATATATADAAVDVTNNIKNLRFQVPEVGATTGSIEMLDPPALADLGMEQPIITGDRPIRIAVAGMDVFRGTMKFPTLIESVGELQDSTDLVRWDLADRYQDMVDTTIQAAYPFDGIPLSRTGTTPGAIQKLLTDYMAYTSSDYTISSNAFELPYTPGVSAGEWSLLPQRGDTVAQWVERLYADYAGTFYTGWVPTLTGYKFWFVDPADLSDTPVLTIYQNADDAIAAGVSAGLVEFRTVRGEVGVDRIRPEANQIIVIGNDLRTGREIVSQYNDAAAQDPTTAPASRPENWSGKVITFTYSDPAITTQDAADRARDQLAERLAVVRVVATWNSELLIRDTDDRTLWKGDVVRVIIEGGATYEDYRIQEFSAELSVINTSTGEALWDCEYKGERIASGTV